MPQLDILSVSVFDRVRNSIGIALKHAEATPKNLDPFLLPLIDALEQLREGVPAYDALSESQFILRAHLVLVTGDAPAISKIFHISSHNAVHPCSTSRCYAQRLQVLMKISYYQV